MCHFFNPAFVVQKPGWWSSTPTALATALLNGREVPIPDLVPKSCLKTLAPPSLGHNWKLHPIAIVKMFTFTWIYWYTLTRSSQKLLAWWSGRGFNLKAQLALDHEPCAAAVWSWEGHGLASAEAELGPTRVAIAKDEFPHKPVKPAWGRQEKQRGILSRSAWKMQICWNGFFPSLWDFCLLKEESRLQDEVSHHYMRNLLSTKQQ